MIAGLEASYCSGLGEASHCSLVRIWGLGPADQSFVDFPAAFMQDCTERGRDVAIVGVDFTAPGPWGTDLSGFVLFWADREGHTMAEWNDKLHDAVLKLGVAPSNLLKATVFSCLCEQREALQWLATGVLSTLPGRGPVLETLLAALDREDLSCGLDLKSIPPGGAEITPSLRRVFSWSSGGFRGETPLL